MAITKQQAIELDTFHIVPHSDLAKCYVWRRNGRTQTWATRPNDFRVPVKFGMRNTYNNIFDYDADKFYAPSDCPACHGTKP